MGINIGSLLAPIIVGTLGQTVNYHLGFLSRPIGMLVGLIVYYFQGKHTLKEIGKRPSNPITATERPKLIKTFILALVIVGIIFGGAAVTGHLTIDFFINFISVLGIGPPVFILRECYGLKTCR